MRNWQKISAILKTLKPLELLFIGFTIYLVVVTIQLPPWGHDAIHHLFRLNENIELFEQGKFHACLSPNAANGKGLPVYIYYSQWVYLIPYLFVKSGLSLLLSLKIAYFIFVIVSCVSIYKLLRIHVSRDLSCLGGLLYISTNYILGDIIVRSAYSEFASYALLPLLLYNIHKAISGTNIVHSFYSVVISSLMILFYPMSLMNSSGVIACYIIIIQVKNCGIINKLWRSIQIFGSSFSITIFFWLPAVIEKQYVMGSLGVRAQYFDSFIDLRQYFYVYDYRNLGLLLPVLIIGILFARIYFTIFKHQTLLNRSALLLIAIAIYSFLTHRFSGPIWDNLQIIQSNIFVWRLLYPLSITAILYVVINIASISNIHLSYKVAFVIGILSIVQGAVFLQHHLKSTITFPESKLEYNIKKYASQESGWGVGEYLPNLKTIGGVVKTPERMQYVNSDMYNKQGNNIRLLTSKPCNKCYYRLPIYWNIRYTATINGQNIPIYASKEGYIIVFPNSRQGEIYIKYDKPIYVKISGWISSISIIVLILLGISKIRVSKNIIMLTL